MLAEQAVFTDKAGLEILGQMYSFPDKENRPIYLIPEVTAIIQKLWREEWRSCTPKPYCIFYIQRCNRYGRPQAGRYRELTHASGEILGGKPDSDRIAALESLQTCLDQFVIDYRLVQGVKRGLSCSPTMLKMASKLG